MEDLISFTIRLPKKVHDFLVKRAESQGRSINKQIEWDYKEKLDKKP